ELVSPAAAMTRRRVHLERVLGRRVSDPDGRVVGRLEEVRVERRGEDWVVAEYLLGAAGLLARLSIFALRLPLARGPWGYRARWDQLDPSDPERPRLRCPLAELTPIGAARRPRRRGSRPRAVDPSAEPRLERRP
ncbi:MAG TPA: hypothetical protein VKA21_16075, partial [Candidatus Binatia bacterium]|nr:hypothetical protein [Candidatus Binatia bacterium]